jgi:hypothetical protein
MVSKQQHTLTEQTVVQVVLIRAAQVAVVSLVMQAVVA